MNFDSRFLLIFILAWANSPAQTNTFPSSGNVGIGLTNPGSKLAVDGDIDIRSGSVLKFRPAANDWDMFIKTIGSGGDARLGIYTGSEPTSPIANFHHGGKVSIGLGAPWAQLGVAKSVEIQADDADSKLTFHDPNNMWYTMGIDYSDGRKFKLGYGGEVGEVIGITLTNTGQFGIGTASPSAALTVTSGQDDARIKLYSNGGSVAMIDAVANSNETIGRWLSINPSGANVGIGTTSPSHKLTVNGTIRAKEVIVDTGWADYVFASDYRLAPLGEVEQHIKENKHLPGIPSAKEVAEQGISIGDMQARLLAKIEELTLHQIAQEKRIERLERENAALRRH